MSHVPRTEYRNLLVTADETSARITLNRPEKRNALSLELMDELIAALHEASAQTTTCAIVIEGAGRLSLAATTCPRWSAAMRRSTATCSTSARC